MLTTVKQVLHLLAQEPRGRWVLLITLALLVTGAEMVAAALVYTLMSLIADPGGAVEFPLVGDLRPFTGDLDERSFLLVIIGAMAVFFLLRGGLKIMATYVKARVVHNAGARISTRLVEGYLRWPYEVHLRRTSAKLIRNGHQVVEGAVTQVLLPLVTVLAEAMVILGLLTVLVLIAPGATAMAVVVIGGAAVLLLTVIQPQLKRLGRTYHAEAASTLHTLQEAFAGIRDIRLLGREQMFAKRYGRSRLRMARSKYLRTTAEQLPPIVTETALLGFILLYFVLALFQGSAVEGTLSVLGLFAYAGLRIQPSLQLIVKGLNNVKYATAPIADVHRDLRSVEALPSPSQDRRPLAFEHEWRATNLRFRYAGAESDALRDVDLSIRPGEQIGICGPTGGGKTTLVDLLAGLLVPTEGTVTVDGQDLREVAHRWYQNLGFVSQMAFLTDETIRRNIALGVADDRIDEDAVWEAVHLAQLEDVIAGMPDGLETIVGERGVRISGGQRQRLAIARALYRQPEVLILDEGTSALDNTTESALMQAIESFRGERTIVLIAHRLSTVRKCDRVVFIEAGRIAGVGSYEELQRQNADFRDMAASGA